MSDLDNLALGLALATISDTQDEKGLGRIRVKFILKGAEIQSDWIQLMSFFGGPDYGAFALPQTGDSVLVGFANGDPNSPYVLGYVWNGAQKPPVEQSQQQDVRVIKTKAGKLISFDDSEQGRLLITDEKQNVIELNTGKNEVTIQSQGDLTISAKGKITIKGAQVTLQNEAATVKVELSESMLQAQGGNNIKLNATMIDLN